MTVPYNQRNSHQLPPFIKLRNADGTEDIHYSIFYDGVPNEYKYIAPMELNETEENKRKGIERLRGVLKEKGISGIDDHALLCCLRKSKYNFNKSETALLKFLKSRQILIEKLQAADMKKLEHVLDHMVVGFLPYRDKSGRPIFYSTPNINLELFDVDDAFVCYFFTLMFILSFPLTSIAGIIYIAEAKTPQLDLLYPIMKTLRQNLFHLTSLPGRTSKLEILNEIFIVRWTVNLIKPIITAKAVDRINFYGSEVRNLRNTYHPELLPEEFGGTMGPLSNKFCKEELLNFFKRMRNES